VTSLAPAQATPFGPITVEWDQRVLQPRPWTLAKAEWAAELAGDGSRRILELHCGAGSIGLAAAVLTGRSLVQVDDSPAACGWARRNAARLGVRSDVRCGKVEAALRPGERFTLVLADPPYIESADVNRYPADPAHAIDGGPDGLSGAIEVMRCIPRYLEPRAAVLMQVRDDTQARAVEQYLADTQLPLAVEEVRGWPEGAVVLFRFVPGSR
jgi:release factor glutamine methyltransferase